MINVKTNNNFSNICSIFLRYIFNFLNLKYLIKFNRMLLTFVGTAHCTFHGIIEKLNIFFASSTKFSLRLVKDSVIKIFGLWY